jgi:hypothetical protein
MIMAIRHGEKPSEDGSILGVDPSGANSPDELSVKGWQRAGALAVLFANPTLRPGLRKPEKLYAPGTTAHVKSMRAYRTLQPLAEVLQLDVSTAFHKGGEAELARNLEQAQGVVLIAWEHHALCQLANDLLGRNDSSPQDWPDERFDLIWVFDRAGASWNFKQVPQMLLKGDVPQVLR